jgi:hypothetical protein
LAGTITGTITADNLTGVTAQGIAAGDLTSALEAVAEGKCLHQYAHTMHTQLCFQAASFEGRLSGPITSHPHPTQVAGGRALNSSTRVFKTSPIPRRVHWKQELLDKGNMRGFIAMAALSSINVLQRPMTVWSWTALNQSDRATGRGEQSRREGGLWMQSL